MPDSGKPKFFYGYVVVAAGFLVSVLLVGAFASFGVFFKPLSLELGWTRAVTSSAMSVANLVMGISCIFAGRLTDKYGPRVVLLACGLFLGLGHLLMSQVSSLWQLYLFYGVMVGVGMSGSEIPIATTVARWFVKRRGIVIGITKAGAGIGFALVPLLANSLIISDGWRSAYTTIGIISLVGIVAFSLLYKRDPSRTGQLPYGVTEVETAESNIDIRGFSLREAMGTRQFWMFSAVWFIFVFCMQIILVHIVPHATDLGISATIAATILSMIGGFSILGRLGMGGLSDRLGTKSVFVITACFLGSSLLWVQFAQEVWMFYLFAAIYGIAHGGYFALLPLMVARLFGLLSLGTILGAVLFIGAIGGTIGPVIAGRVFDVTGSYQPVLIAILALSIISIILMLLLRPIKK